MSKRNKSKRKKDALGENANDTSPDSLYLQLNAEQRAQALRNLEAYIKLAIEIFESQEKKPDG